MKTRPPSLAPLLRSNAQGDLLALLLLHPDQEYTLAELGRRVGSLPATVHREISRLVASGLLEDQRIGSARLIRANTADRLYAPTRALIEATYGPKVVLEDLLRDAPAVEHALIFGSWAARYAGIDGLAPRDVDVLLIGDVSQRDAIKLAAEASRRTHQEVNIERISAGAWAQKNGPFLTTILSKLIVELRIKESGKASA